MCIVPYFYSIVGPCALLTIGDGECRGSNPRASARGREQSLNRQHDYGDVYSSCVTATCRSLKMMLGMIPKISATARSGSSTMNSRRVTSVVYDRYCEYAPNASRLNRKIL